MQLWPFFRGNWIDPLNTVFHTKRGTDQIIHTKVRVTCTVFTSIFASVWACPMIHVVGSTRLLGLSRYAFTESKNPATPSPPCHLPPDVHPSPRLLRATGAVRSVSTAAPARLMSRWMNMIIYVWRIYVISGPPPPLSKKPDKQMHFEGVVRKPKHGQLYRYCKTVNTLHCGNYTNEMLFSDPGAADVLVNASFTCHLQFYINLMSKVTSIRSSSSFHDGPVELFTGRIHSFFQQMKGRNFFLGVNHYNFKSILGGVCVHLQ